MKNKLIIGGVDEAFNVPWKRIVLRQPLQERNVELEWIDFGGGTGQIMRALNSGEIHAAIVLTEGVVADICRNNGSRIYSSYVTSPLEWGIHVHEDSSIQSINDLIDKSYAISKFGSGSHLMAILNAYERAWSVNDLKFVEVNNLQGGLNALNNKTADVFFWEKHTTRSYLKPNHLRYVDSFRGPWGAFVLAVNAKLSDSQLEAIHETFKLVLSEAENFKLSHLSAPHITRFNNMDLPTAQSWLRSTNFAFSIGKNQLEVMKVKEVMFQSGILKKEEIEQDAIFIA